jgi:hypothetical protein
MPAHGGSFPTLATGASYSLRSSLAPLALLAGERLTAHGPCRGPPPSYPGALGAVVGGHKDDDGDNDDDVTTVWRSSKDVLQKKWTLEPERIFLSCPRLSFKVKDS